MAVGYPTGLSFYMARLTILVRLKTTKKRVFMRFWGFLGDFACQCNRTKWSESVHCTSNSGDLAGLHLIAYWRHLWLACKAWRVWKARQVAPLTTILQTWGPVSFHLLCLLCSRRGCVCRGHFSHQQALTCWRVSE